ncbi:hypothetical protein TI39_contig541g00018 [Zymoseptoria brevis]|uniref:Alpha/beta hydrolase fold-3 domain-containing protein n=1 Tax=Zymoseptoria brevis TaxID=1047168 RepID=A0A0F4GLU1_9PEZI|nr:hypothetical protein TI39_contig541g00018 [Zymoseptoria brevis]
MLEYLRLKLLVTFVRLPVAIKPFTSGSRPQPDEVINIPSRESSRVIIANVYKATPRNGPQPALINFHGSGFVLPLRGSDEEFCRHISTNTDYTVIDVAYRLTPEYPFPAALEDVEDAIKWAMSPARTSASSFSKGTIKSVIAYHPPVDIAQDPDSEVAPDPSGKPIPVSLVRIFNECYLQNGVDPKDPRVSPTSLSVDASPSNLFSDYLWAGYSCFRGRGTGRATEEGRRNRFGT